MRVYAKIVTDMESMEVVESIHYEYNGPVALCKRGQAKSLAEQQMQQDQQRAMALSKLQQSMLGPTTGFLQGMVTNPTGFSPADLAAMRTQSMQDTSNKFVSGLQQLKASLASRGLMGGSTPTSGLAANDFGNYVAQGAQAQAGNLANINIQNALQAQNNRWNAGGALGNYAQTFSPSAFIGGAGTALGSRTSLETAPTIASEMAPRFSFGGTMKMPR